jgi:hypothetical protein
MDNLVPESYDVLKFAYLVGPSFDSEEEKGKTACNMCGNSFKGINIHRTSCRKRMEQTYHFV